MEPFLIIFPFINLSLDCSEIRIIWEMLHNYINLYTVYKFELWTMTEVVTTLHENCLFPVCQNGEIAMLGEITHLQAIIDDLTVLTTDPHKLPPASEQVTPPPPADPSEYFRGNQR